MNRQLLIYLSILTVFFALIEVSFFITCHRAYFAAFSFVSEQLTLPLAMLPGILFYLLAQCLLHVFFCLLVFFATLTTARFFHLSSQPVFKLATFFWVLAVIFLLLSNQALYPNSAFADLTALFVNQRSANILSGVFAIFWLVVLIVLPFLQANKRMKCHALIFMCVCFSAISFLFHTKKITDGATDDAPNIIFIGMDSLRPDFLGFLGGENRTPHLDAFLKKATVFADATTPLARTFPSWSAILSGEYPRESKVRSNLAAFNPARFAHTLPARLKQQSYQTFYATDETRFSNIDHTYGFDHLITPPVGLNDFLLGTLNDFPLSNLILNTRLGAFLFPYSYANRASFITYDPDSFLHLLDDQIPNERHQPLFIAAHFCLTHHPYVWRSLRADDYSVLERYQLSIEQADKQVGAFLDMLSKKKLLSNAIVVMLSDHGEALELNDDRITARSAYQPPHPPVRFYPESTDDEAVNQSAGHGTDVLGMPQYHVLLSFRRYGGAPYPAKIVSTLTSLLDIKPTILELVDNERSSFSLAPILRGETVSDNSSRHFFLESDFSPAAIRTVHPEMKDVLLEGLELFEIKPHTLQLIVKPSMEKMIIQSKQYADIYQNWMLAFYPIDKSKRLPILINLETGEWTDDLHSPLAMQSPEKKMLHALKSFYGEELTGI